ncbi:hypothetical protein Haur_2783 [Herpetosiphon aurantiacus DSM 785]|uniref:Uncharacterized protein n=1 Tax=Herpetosiphon aurantiacus (strain ATCC 23779 / DSM 785 / 114-95) TaxID=316274 RepID=A9B1X9_HERA2|nr:hypothetical protein Haur_2783 [Herpetosiphon aurantiacus DSM 785]
MIRIEENNRPNIKFLNYSLFAGGQGLFFLINRWSGWAWYNGYSRLGRRLGRLVGTATNKADGQKCNPDQAAHTASSSLNDTHQLGRVYPINQFLPTNNSFRIDNSSTNALICK